MADIFTKDNLLFMLKGAGWSLILAIGGLVIGCVIGIIFAACKRSRSRLLRLIANVYVEVFRGTPTLLQVLFFYLGVPVIYQRITGMRMSANPYLVGLIALSGLSCTPGAPFGHFVKSSLPYCFSALPAL